MVELAGQPDFSLNWRVINYLAALVILGVARLTRQGLRRRPCETQRRTSLT